MDTPTSNYHESLSLFHGCLPAIMGTRFEVLMADVSEENGNRAWQLITDTLHRIDRLLNRFDATSEVSRLQAGALQAPVAVSGELWSILTDCAAYHQRTNGLFDITLGNFSQLTLHPDTRSVALASPAVSLDFGGYAKGYALEQVKAVLAARKIAHAFVDFGRSSILGLGHHPHGDCWKVSVENPYRAGETVSEFSLKNEALSTSGNTPDYTQHIVNPRSGEYVGERKTVSVISPNAVEAEVLSTVLMIEGEKDADFLAKFNCRVAKVERW